MPALELFEDLAGLLDPTGVPLDADLAMPGDDLDPEGVADLTEELVPAAEDRKLLVVVVERDRDFGHALPFDGLGFARRTRAPNATKFQAGRTDSSLWGEVAEKRNAACRPESEFHMGNNAVRLNG